MIVKEVTGVQEKSTQEKEQEIIDAAEAQQQQQDDEKETITVPELNDEAVINFIKSKYNKEISSIDELFQEKPTEVELPDDVKGFYEYKQKTGRGINDYIKLNRDISAISEDSLLREYILATEEGIDESDVDVFMDEYKYDEDFDDESEVKKKNLARKKALSKARQYFEQQKEMYKEPNESFGNQMSATDKEALAAYNTYKQQLQDYEAQNNQKRDAFMNKTDELFSNDFKGFDFEIDGKQVVFSPSAAEEIKKAQTDTSAFMSKFLDENGVISDIKGYHRALAVAMNPEKFAKFFYDQGKAEATDDVTRRIKNVDMGDHRVPEITNKGGFQVKTVENKSYEGGLRVRK